MPIEDPLGLFSAARNKNKEEGVAILEKNIRERPDLSEYIKTHGEELWRAAFMVDSYTFNNTLLENFPDLFEYLSNLPHKKLAPDQISYRFIPYYFASLDKRIAACAPFNIGEIRLCYSILKHLIRTYPNREEISDDVRAIHEYNAGYYVYFSNRATGIINYLQNKNQDPHFSRIEQLLSIPAVHSEAVSNLDTLIDLAGKEQKIIGILNKPEATAQIYYMPRPKSD